VRIKVDQNIGRSGVDLLRQAGQDVMTVREQGMRAAQRTVSKRIVALLGQA